MLDGQPLRAGMIPNEGAEVIAMENTSTGPQGSVCLQSDTGREILPMNSRKRAIIVGNSPSLLKTCWGTVIDQFDTVIRLNNFELGRYGIYVGTKTDHAVISFACHKNEVLNQLPPQNVHLFVGPHSDNLEFVSQRMRDKSKNAVELDAETLDILDEGEYFTDLPQLAGLPKGKWPSTGTVGIWWALKNLSETHDIYIHGFSFFRESETALKHYYDWEPKRDRCHDFESERQFVSRLIEEGKICVLDPRDDVRRPADPSDYFVLSHHSEDRDIAVCKSAHSVFLDEKGPLREKSKYVFVKNKSAMLSLHGQLTACKSPKIVFNGGFSVTHSNSLELLERVRHESCPVAIYWHETAWALQRLAMTNNEGWSLLKSLVSEENVEHWVVSSQGKQLISHVFDVPFERVKVVGECVEVKHYLPGRREQKDQYRVVGAGCVTHRKGVDYFVSVCNMLEGNQQQNYQCMWYGGRRGLDGKGFRVPEEALMSELLGTAHKVQFPGFVNEFSSRLSESDIFLLTSRDDPQAIVALEALACDIPVFCFDSVGTAELLPREFVSSSPRNMVIQVEDYLKNIQKYPPGFFRSIAEEFTPKKFVERIRPDDSLAEQPLGAGEYAVVLPSHLQRTHDLEQVRGSLRIALGELDRRCRRSEAFEKSSVYRLMQRLYFLYRDGPSKFRKLPTKVLRKIRNRAA